MILFTLFILIVGLFFLVLSAKFVVISLENIAKRFGVSQLLVGLIFLSIGTSLPEIAVSVIGAIDKITGISPNIDGIVIGNKVGSFMTQITLILGILGLSQAIFISKWELKREGTMMFISVFVFLICSLDGTIYLYEGIILVLTYFLYLLFVVKSEKKRQKAEAKIKAFIAQRNEVDPPLVEDETKSVDFPPLWKDIAILLVGLAILIFGAELTILSAHDFAIWLNVPDIIIGIFIVGLGTSLPELVADLTALKRDSHGLAIGDILGSNICDILLATGSGALIVSFNVPIIILYFDIPLLLGAIGLTCYFLWTRHSLTKWEAALLIGFYGLYAFFKLAFFQI